MAAFAAIAFPRLEVQSEISSESHCHGRRRYHAIGTVNTVRLNIAMVTVSLENTQAGMNLKAA